MLSRVWLFYDPMERYPARFLCPWDFPGKNTGVGCLFLLQGIFLTPEIEPTPLALADGFFTTDPLGNPKLTFGVNFKFKINFCQLVGTPLFFSIVMITKLSNSSFPLKIMSLWNENILWFTFYFSDSKTLLLLRYLIPALELTILWYININHSNIHVWAGFL